MTGQSVARHIVAHRRAPQPRRSGRIAAFTLIEVLIVVAIIAIVVAILLPSLSAAKRTAVLATCKANLRQVSTGIATYSMEQGVIPHGPVVPPLGGFLEGNDGRLATSQVWTGPQTWPPTHMGLGLLLRREQFNPKALYCPGDDTNNREEELPKVINESLEPAFGSYMYRQMDAIVGGARLENLGRNERGEPAVALAFDLNSRVTVIPGYSRSNHKGVEVNVASVDTSVRGFDNREDAYSLRNADFGVDPTLFLRRDEILQDLDAIYRDDGP